jgi:hypothetical protein
MSQRSASETFKDVMAGVQSIAIILAAVLGGVWTLYVFQAFAQKDKASAELEELNRRLQGIVIDTKLDAKQQKVAGDKDAYLSATVSLTNRGNQRTRLILAEPLTVARLQVGDKTEVMPKSLRRFPAVCTKADNKYTIYGLMLRPNETIRLPFFVRVPERGLYLVEFYVEVDPDDPNIRHIPEPQRPVYWGDAINVWVE